MNAALPITTLFTLRYLRANGTFIERSRMNHYQATL